MSDYTEHLISMAGGDGDQLAAIEAIIQPYASTVEERRGVHPDSVFTAAVDLLAMVREQRAALDRVEAQLADWASLKPFPDADDSQRWYSLGKRHAAEAIRTALTATDKP
jgi:hypothetical protein